MDCKKKKQRSFFDLFRVYSCRDCIKNRRDEYIVIGKSSISMYPIGSMCGEIVPDEDWGLFDKRLQRLLYEFSLNRDSLVLLWERFETPLESKMILWEILMDLGDGIHIIDD